MGNKITVQNMIIERIKCLAKGTGCENKWLCARHNNINTHSSCSAGHTIKLHRFHNFGSPLPFMTIYVAILLTLK